MADAFRFRAAVTRAVPASLPAAALRQDPHAPPVDLARARAQHAAYVAALRRLVPTVVELPEDPAYPDSVFVEDAAVCIGPAACITRPGHPSRRGEVDAIETALRAAGLATVRLADLAPGDADATVDGGDVLWTGREIFVGLSSRTNATGAAALQRAFPAWRVVTVAVAAGLHLKSFCAMAAPDVVAVGPSPAARAARAAIEAASPGVYRFLELPTDAAANCVVLNGHVLHVPAARGAFDGLGVVPVEVANDELAKVDGALTCCSLLLA